jgi:hypothetical protein
MERQEAEERQDGIGIQNGVGTQNGVLQRNIASRSPCAVEFEFQNSEFENSKKTKEKLPKRNAHFWCYVSW